MKDKGGIIGGIITLIIGGVIYNVNKADIVKNFSKDTGLSQEQAQQYVENIKKEDLVTFDKVGSGYISDGRDVLSRINSIDCSNYTYKWETYTLTCQKGKSQLATLGNDEVVLGEAYVKLASDSATKNDISNVIILINSFNTDLNFEIVGSILTPQSLDQMRKTNSYNKALLQAALDSKR